MRCIIPFVFCNLVALALSHYTDYGNDCLEGTTDEKFISTQPMISYTATPYPFVRSDTNITLMCTGHSVQPDFVDVDDKSYMMAIEFYKNGNYFRRCEDNTKLLKIRSLSCNTTVSGVTNNDSFLCVVRASNAPCNGGAISFQIEDNTAPNVSRLITTFKAGGERMEVRCVGAGIPQPRVTWLLNGSMVNRTSTERTLNSRVDSRLANFENGTNVYRTISRIVIADITFPLTIQCVVENDVGKVYSETVYTLYIKVKVLRLSTATIHWVGYPHMNRSLPSEFNVTLKCGENCFEITRYYNKSSALFSHLTKGRTYTVKIESSSKTGELIVGVTNFYSPDQLPKPGRIYFQKVTSHNAVVGWKSISANAPVHGVLLGYKIIVIGKNKNMSITLPNNKSDLVLSHLMPKSEYTVRVRGFTQYGNGSILEKKFTTLDTIPAPANVRIHSVSENSAVVKWSVVEQDPQNYDVVTGYRIEVKNQTDKTLETSSDVSSVRLYDLLPNTNYSVSVVGLGKDTEGTGSEWISFKTSELAEPTEGKSSSNLTLLVLPIVIIVAALIVVIVLVVLRVRRWKAKKSKNIKPNQIEVEGVQRTFDYNLRILYPEYYNNDVSDSLEDLPSWEISRTRLAVLDNVLGGGCFGFVSEGVLMKSLTEDNEDQMISVAVKTLKANRGQNDWNELLREFDVLKYVNSTGHPNIIKLIGGCTQEVPLLIVMEFCSGGNLKDLLRNSRVHQEYKNIYSKLTERQLINFAVQIAKGMKFLFEKKVVHRDIASRNILLNDQLVPKIADFGLARKIDVTSHYVVNKNRLLPVKWMSIESLAEGRFNAASDTWSYGILLWEICTLAEEPYADVSPYDMLDYLHDGNRMTRPEHCSIEIFSIMENCWQEDPEERPNFNNIYNSLENMLTQNERSYINVLPYIEVDDTMVSESGDLFPDFSRKNKTWELGEFGENSSNDSGVHETSF